MAASRGRLKAVGPEDVAAAEAAAVAAAKPKTVSQAAHSGTERELLVATRDRIALAVENPNTPARDLAALTKRLMETVREIKAIDARAEEGVHGGAEVLDGEFDAAAI